MAKLVILAAAVVAAHSPLVVAAPDARPTRAPAVATFARAAVEAQFAAPKPARPVAISGDEAARLTARARQIADAPAAPSQALSIPSRR